MDDRHVPLPHWLSRLSSETMIAARWVMLLGYAGWNQILQNAMHITVHNRNEKMGYVFGLTWLEIALPRVPITIDLL
jgi:Na+/proline symporter